MLASLCNQYTSCLPIDFQLTITVRFPPIPLPSAIECCVLHSVHYIGNRAWGAREIEIEIRHTYVHTYHKFIHLYLTWGDRTPNPWLESVACPRGWAKKALYAVIDVSEGVYLCFSSYLELDLQRVNRHDLVLRKKIKTQVNSGRWDRAQRKSTRVYLTLYCEWWTELES